MSSTLVSTTLHHGFRLSPPTSTRCQKRFPTPPHHPINEVPHHTRSSLETQPDYNMSAVYHGPQAVTYDSRVPTREHHALAQIERSRPYETGMETYQRYPSQSQLQQYQPPVPLQARHASSSSHPVPRQSTRPSTPNSAHSSHAASAANSTNGDIQSMVLHSLQVPACISPKGGNLADFSAQLTCLFWFESPKILETAENIRSFPRDKPLPRLAATALPTEAFKKWVQTVLSTTQVTQNVILLAVMFIYRLKMTNPSVRGRPGSEYRLLTVALMLGNKFLDDNTYTNKTWAEVSGISVQEIHVMEVEFLSNMRYALLASKEQWEEWLGKLTAYFEFWDRVTKPASPAVVPSPTLVIPSPTIGRGYSPLPSPTGSLQAMHGLSSRSTRYSPPILASNNTSNPALFAFSNGGSNVSPLANRPDLGNNRKRSWDEDADDLPTKRAYRAPPQAATHLPSSSSTHTKPPSDPRRLPVPNLTLNTAHHAPATQPQYTPTTYSMPQAVTLSLPPLEPGIRAMSTVYTQPTASNSSFPPAVGASGSSQSSVPATTLTTPVAQYPPKSTPGYGTPTKRLSPVNTLTSAAVYNTSSPLHDQFPSNNGFSTPVSHSPSVYLQQRASPYRPIRHVHTLLNPPPSASLQSYHLPAIAPSQMHYHPIGRRDDYRTGIVPEYRNQTYYGGNSQNEGLAPLPSVTSQQRYPDLVN
ncbi:Meiotically up-regulated gene 80 protein [Cytospora mali]|uniref:Meiotically up-regulated gene 80 protein n=1 Tax=Cytospora mali TaxID=578113 RepID=A0A194V4K1_CYTMA|nr:Meiotically up-regulated gene 80 protein [Valsa mali var. pyri (nom. inval.)]